MKINKIDIYNAIPIDWNIHYRHSIGIDGVVNKLCCIISAHGYKYRKITTYKEHLGIIVINLFNCYIIDSNMSVYYQRNKSRYKSLKKYASIDVSHKFTVDIVDSLIDLGYAEGIMGHYYRNNSEGDCGKSSRMRATQKLIDLMNSYHIDVSGICRSSEETIVLKDKNKFKTDYKNTRNTNRMRKNLKEINATIASSFVGLCLPDEIIDEMNKELQTKMDEENGDYRRVVDFSRIRLKRIFNNGSFEDGGRFYGGWWQSVPSKYRKYIRIDDEGTEEADFSGYHINLLYAQEVQPLPADDVYFLDGIPSTARTMMKVVLQVLLNAPNRKSVLQAIRREFPREKHPEVFISKEITHESLLDAFMEKHQAIKKYFCSGYGVKLQYIDSQICEEILLELGKKGIVALPIHDSFRVQRRHLDELVATMKRVVAAKYQKEFKLKIDVSAYAEDMKIIRLEFPEDDIPSSVEAYEKKGIHLEEHDLYMRRRSAWHLSNPINLNPPSPPSSILRK